MIYISYLLCWFTWLGSPSSTTYQTTVRIYEQDKEIAKISKENNKICFYKKGICVGMLNSNGEILVGRSQFTKGWLQADQLLAKDKRKVLKTLSWQDDQTLQIENSLANKCGIITQYTIQNMQGDTIATWQGSTTNAKEIYQLLAIYTVYFSDWKLC
ncbi:MAG: hypothetical protein ACFB0B_13385 [Thermonemataceae bacterium]